MGVVKKKVRQKMLKNDKLFCVIICSSLKYRKYLKSALYRITEFLIISADKGNSFNLFETHSYPLLSFTHTHRIIIFAPSSLTLYFSTGVSGVSGVSGASSVSGVSGVSGASGALKKLAGWKSGFGWDYSNI